MQILKQEWPHRWPTFIPDIVSSSRTSLSICENNMAILRLLSEEIFDFSAEQMTQAKTKNLKNQMCGEFSEVFQLCSEVLEKAQKPSLIKATLETMLRFLNWIPLGYIFETNVIDHLINRFLEVPEFRNVTLKCLSEIAGLQVGPEYDAKFVVLFNMVMTAVNRMIPPSTSAFSLSIPARIFILIRPYRRRFCIRKLVGLGPRADPQPLALPQQLPHDTPAVG